MDEKLKKNLLIAGIIGSVVGILFIIISFSLGELVAKGSIIAEKIGWILLFTIGLPYMVVSEVFTLFGFVTSPYVLHVSIISLVLYFLIGALIYYIYYKIRNKK